MYHGFGLIWPRHAHPVRVPWEHFQCCMAASTRMLRSGVESSFAHMQELRGNFDIDVRILGIMSSSRMLLSESSIDLANWKQHFQQCVPALACSSCEIAARRGLRLRIQADMNAFPQHLTDPICRVRNRGL